jgi:hypothetical protein
MLGFGGTCVCAFLDNDSVNIPAEADARNSRTSIARQQISKHNSLKTEAFTVWSVRYGYKEVCGNAGQG